MVAAVHFDGTDDFGVSASPITSIPNGACSFSFWVRSSFSGGSYALIADFSSDGGNGFIFYLQSGQLGIYHYNGSFPILAGPSIDDGMWHHIVVSNPTPTGGEFYPDVYIDSINVLTATDVGGASRTAASGDIGVGQDSRASGHFYPGDLFDMRTFLVALSSGDVTTLYGQGGGLLNTVQSANLQNWWKCDEGSGTTVADSGPDGKNITLTGATWVTDGPASTVDFFADVSTITISSPPNRGFGPQLYPPYRTIYVKMLPF